MRPVKAGSRDDDSPDALAMAFLGGKDKRKELESAYNICPDVGWIAQTQARRGLAGIKRTGQARRPIKMMLASRTDSSHR